MPTQEQIACIFCGKSTLKDNINWLNWENWSIDWTVRQVREMLPGPGRGKKGKNEKSGFPAIPAQGLSIIQMATIPAYAEIVAVIKKRLITIVRAYVQAGIIKRSELRLPREKASS